MADETQKEKLITLSILTHYDELLKKWVLTQVSGGSETDLTEIKEAIKALQEAQDLEII